MRRRMEACSLYDSIGDVVKSLTQCPMSHELETFSRLLYRNKNQHRRDRCFQKLVRVCKDSKKYQDFKLTEKYKCLQRLLAKYKFNLSGSSNLGSSSSKMDYRCDAEVQNMTSELAQQTSRCVLFIKKIIQFCEDTFLEIHQHHLTLGLFVPFNLMMCAILSRLWTYLKYHVKYLSQAHMVLTQDHGEKSSDAKHMTIQSTDFGETVILDQSFMQSRSKDFQLPVLSRPRVVVAKGEDSTVKIKSPHKKNIKPTVRPHHRTRHRWRNTISSSVSHFCVDCWMRSKRQSVRRRKRKNITSFKKKANSKCVVSSDQGTGDSFIDSIFSLIQ